jgi:hypothetical protein
VVRQRAQPEYPYMLEALCAWAPQAREHHPMRIVKYIGLTLVAVYAFSAMAASSASAAEPLFLAHPFGQLLLASAGSSIQKLKTSAGTIECSALKLLPPFDTTPALRFLSILVVVDYENCKAFGLAAKIHPVHYHILANGLVVLVNTVLVLALACTVTIPANKNQSLNTVKFENTPANKGVLLLVEVTKVTSSGTGAACTYAEESAGVAEGTIHITTHGGTIKWDANV